MTPSPRSRFLADHEQLEVLLSALIAAFETGDRDIARETYRRFERELSEHLELEEQQLFPELEQSDPREVEDLRAEHRAIRARLDDLGIGVELHYTRLPQIRDLVEILHAHAAREDKVLYAWADRVFSDPTHASNLENFFTHGRSPAAPVRP
jgi:hemerythrin-like domain-containing protein